MADLVVGGVRLHVQQLGTRGTPVLFVHGLVMDNLASWYFTAASPLSAHRPVVLYDLRGHGLSDKPSSGYGLTALVDELWGVVDGLGIDGPVELVGHSFGGLLALAAALRDPERVGGLALVDGLLPEPGWGAAMAATLRLQGDERDAQIAERFQAWLGRHSARKRNRLADQARSLVERTTLVDDLLGSPAYEDSAYEALGMRSLLLYGGESDVRGHGERLAARMPGSTLELVPGCSHSLMWEETAAVRERIVRWFAEGR